MSRGKKERRIIIIIINNNNKKRCKNNKSPNFVGDLIKDVERLLMKTPPSK
jgi:hypothetical protein